MIIPPCRRAHLAPALLMAACALGASGTRAASQALDTDQMFTKVPGNPTTQNAAIGVAWGDVNNDGKVDLFLVPNVFPQGGHLFLNQGNGTFGPELSGALSANTSGFGAAFADYDNDGNLDLVVGAAQVNYLYHGNGDGTFVRQTTGGIGDAFGNFFFPAWSDFDNDGYVDLFVTNGFGSTFGVKGTNSLFHNNGNGTFTRATTGILANDTPGFSQGAAWADYDNDGLPDLFVANSRDYGNGSLQTSFLYHNLGHGSFEKVTTGPVGTSLQGLAAAAWADYDNSGYPSLFVCGEGTGSVPQKRTLYHNDGKGAFSEAVGAGSIDSDADFDQNCAWEDYDNDGYLDLYVSSGGAKGGRSSSLYHNNGNGTFTRVTLGAMVNGHGDGGGAAWADVNNDGFPDLYVANFQQWSTEPNAFYLNKGNQNGWITITCVGTLSNRSAIGAKVRVNATVGGKAMWQLREISGGSGIGCQNDLRAHFGLGDAAVVDQVRVEWPSGIVQTLTQLAPKQFLTVTEPSLGPPAQLHAVEPNASSVELTWAAPTLVPSGGLVGYTLDRATDAAFTQNRTVVNLGTALTYTDSAIQAGSTYYYRVSAVSTNATSIGSYPAVAQPFGVQSTSRLINLSVRTAAGTGSQTLIAGFSISGGSSKSLLIRATGPALASFGVTGTLPDPVLQIFSGNSSVLTNDNWEDSGASALIAGANARLNAFVLPSGSKDAALLTALNDGTYTAQVTDKGGGSGVALVEVYDASLPGDIDPSRLVNLSARAQVGTGSSILIAGLVISGNAPKNLLIRGVGPTLANYGVSGVLPDPKLEIHTKVNNQDTVVVANDNWGDAPNNVSQMIATFTSVSAFALPTGSKDAALIVTLAPGAYTVLLSGVGNTSGVGLVEVYDLP